MSESFAIPSSPIAVVGVGAIMPDAVDADAFWANITGGRYSISEVPPERWDPALYFSADHAEPDKTYSSIGGWVRDYPWDPISWKLPIPPKVADQMDDGQRWAISAARSALVDAGWPDWNVDSDNVAVVIGNAIGGEKHYETNMRIELPEVLQDLESSRVVRGAERRSASAHPRRDTCALPRPLRRDQRGHDARRTGQRDGGPHRQPVQLPRAELHHRRGLCVGARGHERCRRGTGRPPLRRRDHRRDRPQHGRLGLREVLQDRSAVGDRDPTVRRRCRRLRHG